MLPVLGVMFGACRER